MLFVLALAALQADASPPWLPDAPPLVLPDSPPFSFPEDMTAPAQPVSMAPGYAVPLPTVPGVINPAVTQANLAQTLCNHAKDAKGFTWIHNQRPPTAYTNKIKFALMDAAGYPRSDSLQFELDHKISIEDGGSPTDPQNLWLQPYRKDGLHSGKYCTKWCSQDKDVLETKISHLICSGTIPLAEGRRELQTDWVAAWLARIGNESQARK